MRKFNELLIRKVILFFLLTTFLFNQTLAQGEQGTSKNFKAKEKGFSRSDSPQKSIKPGTWGPAQTRPKRKKAPEKAFGFSRKPGKDSRLWSVLPRREEIKSPPEIGAIEPRIKLGPLYISPFAHIKQQYTDNIFSSTVNKKSEWVHIYTPGIKVLLKPLNKHVIYFGYKHELKRYAKFNEEDRTSRWIDGMVGLNFTGGLSLQFWGLWSKANEGRDVSSSGNIENSTSSVIGASGLYEFGENFRVKAQNIHSDFGFSSFGSRFRARIENTTSIEAYLKVLPNTFVVADYSYTYADYSAGPLNNYSNRAQGGITWEFTEVSNGEFKLGVIQKDFDSKPATDFTDLIFTFDTDFNFSKYTRLNIRAMRDILDGTLSSIDSIIVKNANGLFEHELTKTFSIEVKGGYEINIYDPLNTPVSQNEARYDKLWTIGGGLVYQFRDWMELSLDYLHTDKDSNSAFSSYNSNSFIVEITIDM